MPRVLGIDSSLIATGLCRIDIYDSAAASVKEDENNGSWIAHGGMEIVTATVGAPKPTADKSKRAMVRRVNRLIEQVEAGICECVDVTAGRILDHPLEHPDLIAVESLAYGAKGESAWVLPWVFGRVIELAERYDIPLIVVGTTARAKYATGKGNADKDTVMLAANRRWPEAEVKNNNEADALIVGAVGCHYLGFPICEPTAYMADVLTKVTT